MPHRDTAASSRTWRGAEARPCGKAVCGPGKRQVSGLLSSLALGKPFTAALGWSVRVVDSLAKAVRSVAGAQHSQPFGHLHVSPWCWLFLVECLCSASPNGVPPTPSLHPGLGSALMTQAVLLNEGRSSSSP